MESIQKQIEQRIKDAGSGAIFFASDFADIAKQDNANKILKRLPEDGLIVRCARGIYCYAEKSTIFEREIVTPSWDTIAKIKELLLKHETKDNILQDINLAPAWIRKIIRKIIE